MVERVVTQIVTLVAEGDEPEGGAEPGRATLLQSGPGRYQEIGEIGRGGMGSVYSVRDRALMRVAAMKVLAPRLAARSQDTERFLREARIMAQLDHPNIVPVHEIGTDSRGNIYFTMKQVEGRTLREWIDELAHPPSQGDPFRHLMDAYLKVCDAVAFAHSRGVIHCDIKPDNIMVGPFGQVYLMDWGLARLLSEPELGADEARPAPANQAKPSGTPAFMSPEQAACTTLDERSDIFAMGALLFAVVTGVPPYDENDPQATLEKARAGIVTFPAPPAGTAWPSVLCGIALRATAREPGERHASVADLKNEVEKALHEQPFSTQVYPAGARIVVEGEPGDCAYIIVSGSCVAYKTTEGGQRVVLRQLPAGSVFGETAALSGQIRTATVEAETEVVVNVVSRELIDQNLGLGTRFGAFVVALADRFRELDSRIGASPPPDRAPR